MASSWLVLIDASSVEQLVSIDKIAMLEINSGTASQLDFLLVDGTTIAFDAGTSGKASACFERAKSYFFKQSLSVFDASDTNMSYE